MERSGARLGAGGFTRLVPGRSLCPHMWWGGGDGVGARAAAVAALRALSRPQSVER